MKAGAWELKGEGWTQQRIAAPLEVTKGAVSQWMKQGREGRVEGLKRRIAPGASPRLDDEQRAEMAELLASYDAEDYGFTGKAWTCERVVRWEFGVSYHPAHVSHLLKSLRITRQKPMRRANQRDEEAIERWKTKRWPELKKGR